MCVSTPTAVPLAQAQLAKTDANQGDDTSSVTSSSAASSADAPGGKTGLAFVAQKLITKEDPFMIHKVTGIFALGSFFNRYVVKLLRTGTLGFTGSRFDWLTMSMHMLLSASAIQFRVPSQRQPRRPTMIWHEYRVHAILFTARCFLVYALGAWAPNAGAAVRFATTMAMHVMVDRVTAVHGKEGETTIRGRGNTVNTFVTKMRRGYSFYQFVAVASHLTASPRAMDMGYNTIIAIQSSAFLMTLNRKGLATWQTHFKLYTVALAMSAGYILGAFAYDFGPAFLFTFVAMVATSFKMRTLGVNKYVIWSLFALTMAYFQGGATALEPKALFSLSA